MTKLLTKILIPYDDSSFSKRAIQKAIELAHNLDSEIILFSVINIGYISPPGMLHGLTRSKSEKLVIQKISKKIKLETERKLKKLAKTCESRGVSASYKISEGNISSEILSFAKKNGITLIIIGSQGLHGIGKIKTLGSVSRKVAEQAHCPVLIIH